MKNKKAFTLLELLVVIVIVGIFFGILFPIMGRAREMGGRAKCINNLRQHGVAWHLYLDDHDDYFTPPSFGDETFGGKKGEYDPGGGVYASERPLNRYLDIEDESSTGALDVFYCPSDSKATEVSGDPYNSFDGIGTSYVANPCVLFYSPSGDFKARPLSTITSPHSKVFLERDSEYNNPGHGERVLAAWGGPVLAQAMVLFVDGHVAGPYQWGEVTDNGDDFELFDPSTQRPAIWDVNGDTFLDN